METTMNRQTGVAVAVAVIASFIAGYLLYNPRVQTRTVTMTAPQFVTDLADGVARRFTYTYQCYLPDGTSARNWEFYDRWVKPQLSLDTQVMPFGSPMRVLRRVTNDPSLPDRHVRFRMAMIPFSPSTLEGWNYLRINGDVNLQIEVLLVEYNATLRGQRSPYPSCGQPRA